MASDYCDLMRPSVEQFAYLKCPNKIRAALVNAGGARVDLEAIKRTLANLPKKVEGTHIGEPTDGDGQDFRVKMLVPPVRKSDTARMLRMERRRIAALAALIPDRQQQPKPESPKIGRPREKRSVPIAAIALIERVCAELGVSEERFFAKKKQGLPFAARSLAATLLRERNPAVYTYPRLAYIMERNDHTTILHLISRFGECCEKFPEVAALYEQMRGAGE